MSRKIKQINLSLLLLFLVLAAACGRTPSRIIGKKHRQKLKISNMDKFISISFDKRGSHTVKDVTFKAKDGYIYTMEFKDISPLEGVIRWVPHGEGGDIIQSRAISRWIGTAVNLELPEDCKEVIGVDVGYTSEDERVKNLVYRNTQEQIFSKEYREGLVNRHFGGWLEVLAK